MREFLNFDLQALNQSEEKQERLLLLSTTGFAIIKYF